MNTMAEEATPQLIKEGKAEILVLDKNVFYNPVQEFNRDLSVAVLNLYAKGKYNELKEKKGEATEDATDDDQPRPGVRHKDGLKILEALSATGLRSIRYAKELPFVKQIVANDIAAKAVKSIQKNIQHNEIDDLITASHEDATMVMYQNKKQRFDAVDLDPYGCPSIFLDGAVQCVAEGGLLLVTATDMAVLAGNSPETCYVKYGAVSLKSKACHELALRILLQHIAAHAGRYGRYIVPLLSVSVDFYIRVFVRVYTGQIKCKSNTSMLGMVYQCTGCESMTIHPLGIKKTCGYKLPTGPPVNELCKFCHYKHHDSKTSVTSLHEIWSSRNADAGASITIRRERNMQIGGPVWLGPLHDQSFVSELVDSLETMEFGTNKRLIGVLNVISEELETPLYYVLDRLMSIVKCDTPSMVKFRSALLNAGYNVSFSHANKLSVKTDAPMDVIWDVVRAWEKMHPAKRERLGEESPAAAILTAESNKEITFDLHPLANPASRKAHMSRFQINPTANWGPGARSTTRVDSNETSSKRQRNQNKNSKKRHEDKQSDESPAAKQIKTDV